MQKISDLKLAWRKQLQEKWNLSKAEATAEINFILCELLEVIPSQLFLKEAENLTFALETQINEILKKRLQGKPLQYIFGKAYFFGLQFLVSTNVLIPRPETETLIEIALSKLKDKPEPKILEIGTGSGCISIALAKKLSAQNPQIIATDISSGALKIAEENAKLNQVNEFINFEKTDLVSDITKEKNYDLLISNPPYISEAEFESLQSEVKQEPKLALVGLNNHDGLIYYKQIADLQIKANSFLLELDPGRAKTIKNIFESDGYSNVQILNDLNGLDRFLSAEGKCKTKE